MKNFINKNKYIGLFFLIALVFSNVNQAQASGHVYTGFQYTGGSSSGGNTGNTGFDVNTNNASNIDQNSATLNGYISQTNNNTNYSRYFKWGTSSSNLNQTISISGTTNTSGNFSATVYNLNSNTNYYYQACAEQSNGSNTQCGQIRNFTTNYAGGNNSGNVYVSVSTNNATNVGNNEATLRGSIDDAGGQNIRRYFEWGTSSSNLYQTTTLSGTVGYAGSFSAVINNLNSNSTYYYRACAEQTNNGNRTCGVIRNFTTSGSSSNNTNTNNNIQSSILTTEASGITANGAILNGVVVNSGGSQTVYFEWGTTTGLGRVTSSKVVSGGQSIVSTQLSGLVSGQPYFFRLVSSNGDRGDFKSFITSKATTSGTSTSGTTNTNTSTSKPNTNIINSGEYLNVDLVADRKEAKRGDVVTFTASYENLSNTELKNTVITVQFPEGVEAVSTGLGSIVSSQKIELVIPGMIAKSKGTFPVQAKIGNKVANQQFVVNVIEATYNHPMNANTQINTLDYAIIKVIGSSSVLSAGVGSAGTFFPHTFLGWMILVLLIIILVYLARVLYKKNEEKKESVELHPALRISK